MIYQDGTREKLETDLDDGEPDVARNSFDSDYGDIEKQDPKTATNDEVSAEIGDLKEEEDETDNLDSAIVAEGGLNKYEEENIDDPADNGAMIADTKKTKNQGFLLGGKVKEEDLDEDEEKQKQRKKLGLFCCCFLLLFAMLTGLLLHYLRINNGGSVLAQAVESTFTPTQAPVTESPTPEGFTEAPTAVELTSAPSLNPTTTPPTGSEPTPTPTIGTSVPTTPTTAQVSRLPCNEIYAESQGGNHGDGNFPSYWVVDTYVCSDTYGPDNDHPNRNPWAVAYGRRDCPEYNYEDGVDVCDDVGARWCSLEELTTEIGQGTGCGGDRMYVWTYNDCEDSDGNPGKYMFDFGLRDSRESSFTCETDLETVTSVARCCGDFYESD